jgi:hypothetical protein
MLKACLFLNKRNQSVPGTSSLKGVSILFSFPLQNQQPVAKLPSSTDQTPIFLEW